MCIHCICKYVHVIMCKITGNLLYHCLLTSLSPSPSLSPSLPPSPFLPPSLPPFLQGEKIFYLIPPTEENLLRYEQWVMSSNQSEIFFGSRVPKCFKCQVAAGNTLFIPTGTCIYMYTIITSYLCTCNPEICWIWPKKGNFKCMWILLCARGSTWGVAI